MEQLFIYGGLSGLALLIYDVMRPKKKAETSPPETEEPAPSPDIQRLYRAITDGRGNNPGYLSEVRELNHIARMYDAIKPPGTPAFFDLPDEQIMAVIQRYKGGAV